jgi:hypothetical protein
MKRREFILLIKPDGNWAIKTPDQAEQMVVYTIELQ